MRDPDENDKSGQPTASASDTELTTTGPGRSGRWRSLSTQLVSLALFTLLLTIGCRLALETLFDIELYADFWLRDYLGNLAVALIAFALVQSRGKAMILTSVIVIGFQMANGGKLSVLGTPVSPDDLMNIQNLFYLTDGWRRILLMVVAALPMIALLVLTPWRRKSTWGVVASLAVVSLLITYFSEPLRVRMDTRFGNSVWNQPANFKNRGLALHVAQESVRTLAKVGKHPDKASVMAATQSLQSLPARVNAVPDSSDQAVLSGSDKAQRNVHVIVLESFFDPVTLGPEWVPEDPFPEDFRQLWAETGHSLALSPVFGGYTANAEFETLCGFPVTENAVFFEGWLRRRVPCLPAVLADAGYQTMASHPNVPGFWNRTLAYNLVGFDTYLSKASFDMEDSVDGLLLDHSFYEQAFDKVAQLDPERPVFNYMLTYHGHLPYPSNEKYPDQIKAGRESVLLNGYLNQLWYKSRDLMERLETLKVEDPNALIVIFGDHLPFLGPNYGVYSDALNLPADRAEFTGDMLEYLVSTPLIVIDGQNGPMKLGKMPLYRLPALILDTLGLEDDAGILEWAKTPEEQVIRPVYGMHIDLQADGVTACPDDDSAPANCEASAGWLARTRLLIQDLFSGKQYSLNQAASSNSIGG